MKEITPKLGYAIAYEFDLYSPTHIKESTNDVVVELHISEGTLSIEVKNKVDEDLLNITIENAGEEVGANLKTLRDVECYTRVQIYKNIRES